MILIPGNSGCRVEIHTKKDSSFVRKSTSDKIYAKRLKNQFKKQIEFKEFFKDKSIIVPEIYSGEYSDSGFSFDMEFINYLDSIKYLSRANTDQINNFYSTVSKIISLELEHSINKDCLREFIMKYDSVMTDIKKNKRLPKRLIKKIDSKILSIDSMIIPVGKCHGDLTFSNILVSRTGKNICIIDFLDNFIETPFQDMVKIRQDTQLKWSTHLYRDKIDFARNSIVMKFLDSMFDEQFSKYDFYRNHYNVFQILNILRIFRYISSEDTRVFLESCLKENLLKRV